MAQAQASEAAAPDSRRQVRMIAWHHHGSYTAPRTMFASVGLYLETHVLLLCLCRAFTFVVAICIPDRGHGCLNSIVKCANYVCCAFVLVQDLAKCRFGTISHHRSWEPGPFTPISAGACIDSIKYDQSRASERRPYHFGANASNFRAGPDKRICPSVRGLAGLLGPMLRPWLRHICVGDV